MHLLVIAWPFPGFCLLMYPSSALPPGYTYLNKVVLMLKLYYLRPSLSVVPFTILIEFSALSLLEYG